MEGTKKNRNKNRTFGAVAGSACLGCTTIIYLEAHVLNVWLLLAGIIILPVAVFIPVLLYPLRTGLETLGRWMGIANTYLLLTVIYVLLFVPLNIIFKLSGKDSLKLKKDKWATSYWIESVKQGDSSMKNQY
jgi:ABC-type sulfate transport system permease subunit